MASTRAIASDIWADEWFGTLDFFQQILWVGLFSKCADMQGRIRDNPMYIRSQLWPYQDVKIEQIEQGLAIFAKSNKIYRYEAQGAKHIQLLRWWSYQCPRFAGASQFPPPPGWQDHIRTSYDGKMIEENWQDTSSHIAQEREYCPPMADAMTAPMTAPMAAPSYSTHVYINDNVYDNINDNTTTMIKPAPEVVVVSPPSDPAQMARIGRLLEDTFGLSPTFRDYMADAIDEYGADELEFALNEKAQSGGRTWKYVLGIMENRKNGIVRPARSRGNGHGPPAQIEMSAAEMIRLNHEGRESEYE